MILILVEDGLPAMVKVKFSIEPAVIVVVANDVVLVTAPQVMLAFRTSVPAVVGVLEARRSNATVLVPEGRE